MNLPTTYTFLYQTNTTYSQNIAKGTTESEFVRVCVCVRVCVTDVTSHISHIYKGINAMLIIGGPIKPYIF